MAFFRVKETATSSCSKAKVITPHRSAEGSPGKGSTKVFSTPPYAGSVPQTEQELAESLRWHRLVVRVEEDYQLFSIAEIYLFELHRQR